MGSQAWLAIGGGFAVRGLVAPPAKPANVSWATVILVMRVGRLGSANFARSTDHDPALNGGSKR
jgi:hypothetical protein